MEGWDEDDDDDDDDDDDVPKILICLLNPFGPKSGYGKKLFFPFPVFSAFLFRLDRAHVKIIENLLLKSGNLIQLSAASTSFISRILDAAICIKRC